MGMQKTKTNIAPKRRAPVTPHRAAPRVLASAMRGPSNGIQCKLKVGAANDPAEKEADMVADKVLSAQGADMLATPPAAAPIRRAGPMDQPNTDTLTQSPPLPADQAEIEVPQAEDVDVAGMEKDALAEMESGEPTDEPPDPAAMPLRRAAAAMMGPEGGDAPADVAARIESPGAGRPLPRAVRADLEPRFGTDFSDVRLHDSPADRTTAAAIGARAFAYKSDIWLGEGERAEDRRLMAHELTHVVQQTGRGRSPLLSGKSKAEAQPKREVNRFFDDAILEKIESYARHIPGYTLISYALGKTPIAKKPVERTPENLIYAVLGLHPLGTMLADRLKETRAIPEAFEWISSQLGTLNLTWARVKAVIAKARDDFSVFSPLSSIKPAFKPLLVDIMTFVGAVKDKVLEFVFKGALKLAGPFAEKVWGVVKLAGDTLKLVLADPLKFAANLFRAVGKGFGLFFGNFAKHLKKGLLGFIFGALDGVDIKLPDKLDLKGIISIIFQVLRLTWKAIRKKLVKRLGANGERKVALLEKTVDIIRLLIKEGVLGIWKKMLSMIDNLVSTVMGGIAEFLATTLVKGALSWLAGLSNPVGAVVKVALMIYDFIVMLIERMQQIMDFVKSIFSSIANIAKGNIMPAAKNVEDAIGRTVPLILAFLAALIPITGIASKIQKIMKKLRKPVDKAVNKLIKWLVKKGKKLLSKITGKVNKKRKLPATTFKVGPKTHKLYGKKKGNAIEIYVQSKENTADGYSKDNAEQYGVFAKNVSDEEKLAAIRSFIAKFEAQTNLLEAAGDKVKPESKNKPQTASTKALDKQNAQASAEISAAGVNLGQGKDIDFDHPNSLIRFKANISPNEGAVGSYNELAKKKKEIDAGSARVLQIDHNPNQATLRVIGAWLKKSNKGKTLKTKLHFKPSKSGKTSEADADKATFGLLSTNSTNEPAGTFPAMIIYGKYNSALGGTDKNHVREMSSFVERRTIGKIPDVKEKLRAQVLVKSADLAKLYGENEDPELLKNIEVGNAKLLKRFQDDLKISGDEAAEGEKGVVDNLVRALDVSGQSKGIDFLENEGAVGTYNSLKGKKTLVGFLEADHSPQHADMMKTTEWKLRDFITPDAQSKLMNHPKIMKLPKAKQAKALKALKLALKLAMSGNQPYSEGKGGAVVVAKYVNQHKDLKFDKDYPMDAMKDKARKDIPQSALDSLVDNVIAGKSGPEAALAARRAANTSLRAQFRDKINKRQNTAFNLYAGLPADEIFQANQDTGMGKKAVGVLARIAAKVKSSTTTSSLKNITDTFFPN